MSGVYFATITLLCFVKDLLFQSWVAKKQTTQTKQHFRSFAYRFPSDITTAWKFFLLKSEHLSGSISHQFVLLKLTIYIQAGKGEIQVLKCVCIVTFETSQGISDIHAGLAVGCSTQERVKLL